MFGRVTPDTNLVEFPIESQCFHVTPRLHATPEDRQNACVGGCEKFCRRGRNCCGPHLCDQSSVHHCEWSPCFRIDQKDCCHVRGNSAFCIGRVERDDLYPKSLRSQCRHHSEKTARRIDRDNRANWLRHLASRKI